MVSEALFSSATCEWATPQHIFDELNNEFHFTLDVCSTDENAKCEHHFTMKEDGLAQDWEGTIWMNPPYGREIINWMKKAYESSKNGHTVVCLVPARTDTKWWHEYAMRASEIRLLKGRISFVGATTSAPFPSALVIFNGNEDHVLNAWVLPNKVV